MGRVERTFVMKVEQFKAWLREATREKPRHLKLVKSGEYKNFAFRDGHIPDALTWTTMILVTKSVGGHRSIGLVGVIWNVCTLITKNRLRNGITIHYALHGFRRGRGTGTSTMEENMVHQFAGIFHKPLSRCL